MYPFPGDAVLLALKNNMPLVPDSEKRFVGLSDVAYERDISTTGWAWSNGDQQIEAGVWSRQSVSYIHISRK